MFAIRDPCLYKFVESLDENEALLIKSAQKT